MRPLKETDVRELRQMDVNDMRTSIPIQNEQGDLPSQTTRQDSSDGNSNDEQDSDDKGCDFGTDDDDDSTMPELVKRHEKSDSSSEGTQDSAEAWEMVEDEDVTGTMLTAQRDLENVGFDLQELSNNPVEPEPVDPVCEVEQVVSHEQARQGRSAEVKWGTGETTEVDRFTFEEDCPGKLVEHAQKHGPLNEKGWKWCKPHTN